MSGRDQQSARGGGGGGGRNAGRGRSGGGGRAAGQRGRGRGGRRSVLPVSDGRGAGAVNATTTRNNNNGNNPSNKVDRRVGKRAKQLETMEKKAKEEDAYFRKCLQEARQKNVANGGSSSNSTEVKTKEELFGQQGTQGINFDKYNGIKVEVRPPSGETTTTIQAMDGFDSLMSTSLNNNAQLQSNVKSMNYKQPTPIQRYAIPLALAGKDLMCCAQTGSGKTCAFLLPIIAALANSSSSSSTGNSHQKPQAQGNNNNTSSSSSSSSSAKPVCIILAPTRELASQIELEAQKLTHGMSRIIQPVCVYGGANPKSQLRDLAFVTAVALLIVATPGRLMDFCDRALITLGNVRFLVLDEADRMLDMGFEPQIRKIVEQSGMTPKERGRQTVLFSATFPPQIQKLAAEFLRPYHWIAVGRVGSTTDSITQKIVKVATNDKRTKLAMTVAAIESGPAGRTLIFVQKKRSATWLKKQLGKGGPDDARPDERFTPITAVDIHGDRTQSQREAALESFRSGKCRVLVATDVAARGLDITDVQHVINFDLPTAADDFDSYVHRIGRTGRAGHVGLATSLFVPGDNPKSENGRIAALLIAQLRESGQEVPSWLLEQQHGGGGAGMTGKRKQQFGGTDARREEESDDHAAKRQERSSGTTIGSSSRPSNGGGRGGGRGENSSSRGDGGGRGRGGGRNNNNNSSSRGRGGRGGGRGGRGRGRGGNPE